MAATIHRAWFAGLLLLASLEWSIAQEPMPPVKGSPAPKLPPGAMILIGDDVKELLRQLEQGLPPEKFKELLDQAEALKRQGVPEKPVFRGSCLVTGKVEGDVAQLRAEFDFKTHRPREMVPLGCQKAWPVSARLDDGKLPLLSAPGEDGYLVQVDQPGTHRLVLDLEAPVAPRGTKGTERGFELGLPRAAITILENLQLPPSVRDVRIPGQSVGDRRKYYLGPIDRLEVTWRPPAPPPQTEVVFTADGEIDVAVDENNVTTHAKITLKPLRGQPKEIKLHLPIGPQTSVDPDSAGAEERAPVILKPADAKSPIWTVRLKDASADPVVLLVRTHQVRAGKPVGIGPFLVLGAVRQQGTIKVSAASHLRVRIKPRSDLSQREVTEEQRRTANTVGLYAYWGLTAPVKESQAAPPALEIEAEPIKGAVETRTSHTLQLTPEGWAVTTEIDVNAERLEIDRLEIDLPANYDAKAAPAGLVEPELDLKDGRRWIKLTAKRDKQFKILVKGIWPLGEEPAKGVVSIPLIRPLQTIDGGCTVRVAVPDHKELLIARETGMTTLPPGKRSHTFTTLRAPARVEIAWQEYRPELPVDMQVDLTLLQGQGRLRQRLRLQFPADALRQLVLRVSAPLPAPPVLVERLPMTDLGGGAWSIDLKDIDAKARTLTLEYSFPVEPDRAGGFAVPLIWPEGITQCLTKFRIWSDPGVQPVQHGKGWEELPLETVAGEDRLPALVLRRSGVNVPLRLREVRVASLPTLTVDRVLVQAAVTDAGHQSYRVRFLIARLTERHLDVELPGPLPALNFEAALDGKKLTAVQPIDEAGNAVETSRLVRLKLEPGLYTRPVVLQFHYQLPPDAMNAGKVQTTFQPPVLRGQAFPARIRWQVGLPGNWVPVHASGQAAVEQRFGFRAWLPAPRAATSPAELDRWFTGHSDASSPSGQPALGLGSRNSDLVCWQAALGSLTVIHVAEQTWLLGCSLVLLLAALTIFLTAGKLRWLTGSLLAVAITLGALFWPDTLPVFLYGTEPGLLVLLLVIGFLWLRQQRYRRQVVFMPGFTRVVPGSSVVRRSAGSSLRVRGEPSTIDAPHAQVQLDVGGSRQGVGNRE